MVVYSFIIPHAKFSSKVHWHCEFCYGLYGCTGQGSLTFSILSIFYRVQEPSCDAAENNVQPVVSPEEPELCSKMVFPELKETDISRYINQQENMASDYTVNRAGPCVVPSNPMSSRQQHYMYIPSRKLEVLRDCVDYIFENKISEARKVCMTIYYSMSDVVKKKNVNCMAIITSHKLVIIIVPYSKLYGTAVTVSWGLFHTTVSHSPNVKPSVGKISFVFALQFLCPYKKLFVMQLMYQLTS